jgi:hypothetical protein
MSHNYSIVLFKNKTKKKIINKFKTLKRAEDFYKSLVDISDSVLFPMEYENGVLSTYEIALVSPTIDISNTMFIKDEFGRQVRVKLDESGHTITKISKYNIEESFIDYSTGKKITTPEFIKTYLKKEGFKLLSKLNNKIVLQNDDDFKLFTLKNVDDSDRFINILSDLFQSQKRMDCLMVKDYSTSQRKYLYDLLSEKGFSKSYLQRQSTTHPSKI